MKCNDLTSKDSHKNGCDTCATTPITGLKSGDSNASNLSAIDPGIVSSAKVALPIKIVFFIF